MISNLQFLRAFASIAIVFYHTGYFLNGIHTEFGGVAIFFCLSGFMMTYVSRKGTDGFLLNRLIRIVPMYWCATSFLVVWLYSGLGDPVWNWPLLLTPNPRLWFGVGLLVVCGLPFLRIFRSNAWRLDLRAPRRWLVLPLLFVAAGFSMLYGFAGAGQDAVHFMKSLLFIPYVGVDGGTQPMLGVGWALNIEILLYVLFSVCLLLNQRWAPSLVVAAIVGAELLGRLMEVPILLQSYAGSYKNSFASGIVIFYVWRYWLRDRPLPQPLAKWAVFLFTIIFFVWHLAPSSLAPLLQGAPLLMQLISNFIPETVMILALMAHDAGVRVSARVPLLLGAASYSIYLTHGIVLETIRRVGEHWDVMRPAGSFAAAFFAVIVSIVVGVAAYHYLEAPMLNACRAWLRRGRGDDSSNAETRVAR